MTIAIFGLVGMVGGFVAGCFDDGPREKLADMGLDADEQVRVLALFERSAVERERKAFVAGFEHCEDVGRGYTTAKLVKDLDIRYPLPKEE